MSLRLANTPEITQLLFYWQNVQPSWYLIQPGSTWLDIVCMAIVRLKKQH